MGFISYCVSLSLYILSSFLMRYSVLNELNTLDAWWIVVDVWSNSSRCRIVSVYLSWTWCLYTWSVGEHSNFKIFLRTRKIMMMHSNEREECHPLAFADRKRKRYDNAVDVVVRLHDPTDPSTERTAPPRSAHVQLSDVLRLLDPARRRGSRWVSTARRHGDGDGEVISARLRLSTTKIWSRV